MSHAIHAHVTKMERLSVLMMKLELGDFARPGHAVIGKIQPMYMTNGQRIAVIGEANNFGSPQVRKGPKYPL